MFVFTRTIESPILRELGAIICHIRIRYLDSERFLVHACWSGPWKGRPILLSSQNCKGWASSSLEERVFEAGSLLRETVYQFWRVQSFAHLSSLSVFNRICVYVVLSPYRGLNALILRELRNMFHVDRVLAFVRFVSKNEGAEWAMFPCHVPFEAKEVAKDLEEYVLQKKKSIIYI